MANFFESLDSVPTVITAGATVFVALIVQFVIRLNKRDDNRNSSDANETNSFTAITNNLFKQLEAQAVRIEALELADREKNAKINEQGVQIGEQQIKIAGLEDERMRLTEVIGRRDRYISKLLASWGQSTTAPNPD